MFYTIKCEIVLTTVHFVTYNMENYFTFANNS